jgi:MraZ protein
MATGHFFRGSALAAVGRKGEVALPPFILGTIAKRSDSRSVVVAPHETDPCLAAYDPGEEASVDAELERLRLRGEALGEAPDAHHSRARRAFGLAETAPCDPAGRIVLPPLMRRKGRIDGLALFVGTGTSFEIWNPDVARTAGDEALRELAEFRLSEGAPFQAEEDRG